MIAPSINADLTLYKSQLDEFLSRKYVDQPLLLGFTAVVYSKFSTWIDKDIETYYEQASEEIQNGQPGLASFSLIQLLETMWAQFHHPIIKFFQLQHAELYHALIQSLRDKKTQFKLVEMRKLNESFTRYIKSARTFYEGLLNKVVGKYDDLLIPENYFEQLEIPMEKKGLKAPGSDFEANLTFVIYHCLLGLGNLARHSTQIYISYVLPCKSVKNYYKHLKQPKEVELEAKQKYVTALLYYSKCVGLFPTMNEPYNHIGVIFNNLRQKFSAALWFLRSQFTRIPDYPIGKHNLATIFTKPWLVDAYRQVCQKKPSEINIDDAETILLRIIKHYFYPDAHLGSFYEVKTQEDLLNFLFPPQHAGFATLSSVIGNHLTMIFCFYSIAQKEGLALVIRNFGQFVQRYIEKYLSSIVKLPEEAIQNGSIKNVRFILAFVRKNPHLATFAPSFVNTLNVMLAPVDENLKLQILDSCGDKELPVRSYYFPEDVQYKDFLPIGYQFKDFNDNFLFSSGNVSVLFGSDFYTRKSETPSFLDNDAVQRIMKEAELNGDDEASRISAVKVECGRYENNLRLQAIAVQAVKLFAPKIQVDREEGKFVLEKVDIPETQVTKTQQKPQEQREKTIKNKKPKKKKKQPTPETHVPETQPLASQAVPSSLEEIQLMIMGHTSGFGREADISGVSSKSNVDLTISSPIDQQEEKHVANSLLPGTIKIAQRAPVPNANSQQVITSSQSDSTQRDHSHVMPTVQVQQLQFQVGPMQPSGYVQAPVQNNGFPQQYPPNFGYPPPPNFAFPQQSPLPYDVYAPYQQTPTPMGQMPYGSQGYNMWGNGVNGPPGAPNGQPNGQPNDYPQYGNHHMNRY